MLKLGHSHFGCCVATGLIQWGGFDMQKSLPGGRDRHEVVVDSSPPKATSSHDEMVQACLACMGRGEPITL